MHFENTYRVPSLLRADAEGELTAGGAGAAEKEQEVEPSLFNMDAAIPNKNVKLVNISIESPRGEVVPPVTSF